MKWSHIKRLTHPNTLVIVDDTQRIDDQGKPFDLIGKLPR